MVLDATNYHFMRSLCLFSGQSLCALSWFKLEPVSRGIFDSIDALLCFWQNKIKIKANTRNGFITGATGGFLEGLFGIGGPPAVIYFLAIAKDDKYAYLGTMQLYFVILCVFDLAFRIKLDLITLNLSSFLIPGLICILLGVFVGYKLVKLTSPKQMKYAVYILLFLNGFLLVFQ